MFRYAVRALRKAPGFTAVAVLTLALGIGATTAIFSVVYGVLLRPLPYKDAAALVLIQAQKAFPNGFRACCSVSAPELPDWIEHSHAFESIAIYGGNSYALTTDTGTEEISGSAVSDQFFQTVGGQMALGRPIGPADARAPVVVISHRLWQRQFGGDPGILNRPVTLSGHSYTVVGVTAPKFHVAFGRTDLWVPLDPTRGPAYMTNRKGGGFLLIARLKRGVTLEQARADAENVERWLMRAYPGVNDDVQPVILTVSERLTGAIEPSLLMLFAAVGLVLLVACANLTNLLLARQASRSREMAIRASLGASRLRLVAESTLESAILAIVGGAAGIGLAAAGVAVLVWLEPAQVPRLEAIRMDRPVLLFTLAVSVLAALLSALAPAIQFCGNNPAASLKAGSQTHTGGPAARRFRSALAVAQLAISVTLLVGAGLLGRSLERLLHTDIGIRTDHVITTLLNLSLGRPITDAEARDKVNRLVERIGALPGVDAAGVGASLPPNASRMRVGFTVTDAVAGRPITHIVDNVPATPGFFSALGIPLLKGRFLSSSDGAGAPPVMMLSADTARRFFGTRDPIGLTLPLGPENRSGRRADVTVVGIVGNVRFAGIDVAAASAIYRPYAQTSPSWVFLVARTAADPLSIAAGLRHEIAAIDRQISIFSMQTMDAVVSNAVAQPRFRTVLLSWLAGLALVLAAIGLYGVVAYSVSQRTNEIGVRMALGAGRADVMTLVLGEGVRLALGGVALGLVGAYALARTLATLLYGVTATDAMSFAFASTFLLLVAIAASYVPARRATRVDPLVALRAE